MKRKLTFIFVLFFAVAVLFAQSAIKTVYVTAKGKKYHILTCRTISDSQVRELEIETAKQAGYTACKVCKP